MELTSREWTRVIESCSCVETTDQLSNCITAYSQTTTVTTVNCSKYNNWLDTKVNNYYTHVGNVDSEECSTNRAMRLVGGSTVSEGRLEICHNGQWGTICNQGWTDNSIELLRVCSTLGLPTYSELLILHKHKF